MFGRNQRSLGYMPSYWGSSPWGYPSRLCFSLVWFDRWDQQESPRYDLPESLTGQRLTHHCLRTRSLASSRRLPRPERPAPPRPASPRPASPRLAPALPALRSLWPTGRSLQAMPPVAHPERWAVPILFRSAIITTSQEVEAMEPCLTRSATHSLYLTTAQTWPAAQRSRGKTNCPTPLR